MMAFARSDHPDKEQVLARARAFLLKNVRDDGGIYYKSAISITGGLQTYNTAICMTGLHLLDDPELAPVVLAARKFLAATQRLDGSQRDGGFGYNRKGFMSRPDLNNTTYALEAMRLTQDLEDLRAQGEMTVDIDWGAALKFLQRLQVDPGAESEDAGGFNYTFSDPKAGTRTNAQDEIVFNAYGSMTYSGLLAMIYAQLPRSDPRVRSAVDWAARHWSLDENPGMGSSGLFFFYNVLGKALNAYGVDELPSAGSENIKWREDLIKKVAARQIVDESGTTGHWVNTESKRFLEGDAILVTSYSLLALLFALGK
jgi:squalene-hopene/tetraprenyl-beta-curcumene cyclase